MTNEAEFRPDEIRPGRRSRFRFTQAPQWALLLPELSDAGYRLYSLLLAHVSADRGDGLVWPQQKSLAAMLNKHPNSVSRTVARELVPLGLVDVEVQRYGANNTRRRNVYTVHEEPPEGWEGVASIPEWYTATKPQGGKAAGQPGGTKNGGSGGTKNGGSGGTKNGVSNYTKEELDEGGRSGSAVGRLPGGLAGAGVSARPARKTAGTGGGSAADPKNSSPAPKRTSQKAPRVSAARPVAGEEEVWAALAPVLAEVGVRAGSRPPTLRRAVRLLLGHDTDARGGTSFGAFPRRPEHVLARINTGWYAARGPERAGADYAGPDRIRRPVGYLAQVLTTQECPRPECEAGVLLTTGAECTTCQAQAAERAAAALAARLDDPEPLPDPEPVDQAAVPNPRPTPTPAASTGAGADRRPPEHPAAKPPAPQSHHGPHGPQRGAYGLGWRAVMINPRTGGWDSTGRRVDAPDAGAAT